MRYFSLVIYTATVFLTYFVYLRLKHFFLFKNFKRLVLLLILIVAGVILLYVFQKPPLTFYFFPSVIMPSLLLGVIYSDSLAAFSSFLMSSLFILWAGMGFPQFLSVFMPGIAASYMAPRRVKYRFDMVWIGFLMGFFQAFLYILHYLFVGSARPGLLLQFVLRGGLTGLFHAVLAVGSLPLLERLFSLATFFRLQELSDLSHPLLKRLLLKAPGTFNHSLQVANLAEAAAEAVGANPSLARVGAYFHDIGKMEFPNYYIENMGEKRSEDPHRKLKPTISALIIKHHVRAGIELGKKFRLPQEIIDMIAQHHGTTLISYFYEKAREKNRVDEKVFRYDGPKPRFKESGILMLADSVEAYIRSEHIKGARKIKEAVRRIIYTRLMEGQLDEAGLTTSDIGKIVEVFSRLLSGVHHRRVKYPGGKTVEG